MKKNEIVLQDAEGKEIPLSELVSEATEASLKEMGLELGENGKLKLTELPTEVKEEVDSNVKRAEVSANFIKQNVLPEQKHKEYGVKAVTSETTSMGHTIPTELATRILEKKEEQAVIRNRSFVFQMAGKFDLPVENVTVTGYWMSENVAITESNPTLAKKSFEDNWVAARVLVPWQLMNSTPIAIESYIANLMARKLANAEESKFIGGDGDNEPLGIRDGASSISSIAQAGAGLAIDDLKKLFYEVPSQYRKGATFLTSGNGKLYTDSLKDSNNRPLFDPAQVLEKLFGKDFDESSNIPENLGDGGNETEVYFGDFSYYHIKEGTTLSMDSDKIISKLQTELVAYQAIDGGVTISDAFRKLTGVKVVTSS
jgi:HK97 family phage major capsid protein